MSGTMQKSSQNSAGGPVTAVPFCVSLNALGNIDTQTFMRFILIGVTLAACESHPPELEVSLERSGGVHMDSDLTRVSDRLLSHQGSDLLCFLYLDDPQIWTLVAQFEQIADGSVSDDYTWNNVSGDDDLYELEISISETSSQISEASSQDEVRTKYGFYDWPYDGCTKDFGFGDCELPREIAAFHFALWDLVRAACGGDA